MHELFALSAPWWHFVLRALAIYVLVMVLIRLSGKRAMGQYTPSDLILLILIGNAVQNGINGGDNSLTGALIMAVTLMALNFATAYVSSRNSAIERIIEGVPVVLARDGHLFKKALRRELVSMDDFQQALWENGVDDVGEVRLVLLEVNGSISVLAKGDGERTAKLADAMQSRTVRRSHHQERQSGSSTGD